MAEEGTMTEVRAVPGHERLVARLARLAGEKNYKEVQALVKTLQPVDLAEILGALDRDHMGLVFRLLPANMATAVFEYMPIEMQEEVLKSLGSDELARLLNDMAPDDRTSLFEELPGPITSKLLNLLSLPEQKVAKQLLGYPEETVGRLMTPDYVKIKREWTVAEVLEHIRRHGSDSETLNVLYVVDENGKLVDDLRARQVMLADPATKVSQIMDENFVALKATDDREVAVEIFKRHDRFALPVVDRDGFLLGIVTADDIFDVAEEEATEDIHKFGGTEALDAPYLDVSLVSMIRKRAGWLVILFVGEMLTATAMARFEGEIAKAVVLALFVPLLISSGGNSGSQAATLVIRAMAIGEVKLSDWWRIVRREVLVGAILGLILGCIGLCRIFIWQNLFDSYGEHWFLVGITVLWSLVGVVLWGTTTGATLPLILRKLGLDPATCSAPFVATLVDVTGLVIYFTVAGLVLGGTLL